ncbi:DUF1737 domain-containing protein [Nonomuraea aurantiaca]|uniref:DUF1737 domain-containing protein n=1 Tax=Nonomuraea aurantiaca TaxID=2878562 RepID=UPI001CD9B741|nr:DUF1737 domain-containing protein [Nonomuraea aurantiaca]MCA2227816.1 DUF1737 domain-containing protein [Nonomuraea aurantiaca]
MTHAEDLPRYRVLTGPDDAAFCRRVSDMLDLGYELHGPPSLAFDGAHVIVGQALVRSEATTIPDGCGSS